MEVQTAALPIMPVSTSTTSTTSTTTTTTAMSPPSPKNSPIVTKTTASTTTTTITTTSTTNDPFPTWTFFPDSATYTPPVYPTSSIGATPGSPPTIPSSPPRSPRSSPPPQTSNAPEKGSKGQASSASATSASTPSSTTASSSTPSTHHRILDHCFHVSIETRLKQAEAQYQASRQEQAVEQATNGAKQDDWRKRQRSLVDEAVVLGRKGSNVEAIVDGKQPFFFLSFGGCVFLLCVVCSVFYLLLFVITRVSDHSSSLPSLPLLLFRVVSQKKKYFKKWGPGYIFVYGCC